MKLKHFFEVTRRTLCCTLALAGCVAMLLPRPGATSEGALQVSAECKNGVPHGAYRVASGSGSVRFEGSYADGLRDGDFVFYAADGERMILLPYTRGLLHGTVKAWHGGADPGLKLVSDISAGFINGRHQTWYANGQPRSDFVIEDGEITTGETWNPDGTVLEINDDTQFLNSEIQNDFDYYDRLEQVMDAYPPAC